MFVHLKSINDIRFISSTSIDKLYYLREWLGKLNEISGNFQYLNEQDICLEQIADYANLGFSMTKLPVPEQVQVIEAIVKVNFDDFKQKEEPSRKDEKAPDKNKSIDADKYLSNQLIRLVAMNLCSSINQAYNFASSIPCRDLENILNDQYELLIANQKDKGINPDEAKKFTQEVLSGDFFAPTGKSKDNTKKGFMAAMGINLDKAEKNKAALTQQTEIDEIMDDKSVPLKVRQQIVKDFQDKL